MGMLSIRIDPPLERALEDFARRRGRTKSDVARELLRRQLAAERVRALRARLQPYAEAQGLLADEDFFREFS